VESYAGVMVDDMPVQSGVQSGGSEEGRWSAKDQEAVVVQPLLPGSV